jgi:hypothetical protein
MPLKKPIMPPINVENAGEIILKISALSTSLAHKPNIKATTIAMTAKHNVNVTQIVTV